MTTSSVAAGFVEGKNLDVDGKRGTSTRYLPISDIPKEELSSLVGGGRYGDQSGVGFANIELYVGKPMVPLYLFPTYIDIRDLGTVHNKFWCPVSALSEHHYIYDALTLCDVVEVRRCTLL